ncbi:MAG: hypothetical protein IH874_05895 [Candidatus Dadabacteria bacterium]|nr:hypothetical protein [Candidatus Dadabacteria bacterium]
MLVVITLYTLGCHDWFVDGDNDGGEGECEEGECNLVRIVEFEDVADCMQLEEDLECTDSFLDEDGFTCVLFCCLFECPEESPSPSPSPTTTPTATPPVCVPEPEICNNFIDDDCDKFIDCHDPDCKRDPACAPPPPSSPSPSPSPKPVC